MSKQCNICERQINSLRFGVCFECATAESIIVEGLVMRNKPIPKIESYSTSMAKLKAILKLYRVTQ